MRKYEVRVSQEAERQIVEQMLFIAEDSVDHAFAWERRVMAAIEGLGTAAGYMRDERVSGSLGLEVRRLVFERTYLVFYAMNEAEGVVNVIEFRHGARKPWRGGAGGEP